MPKAATSPSLLIFDTCVLRGEVLSKRTDWSEIKEHINATDLNVTFTVPEVVLHELNRYFRRQDEKAIDEFNRATNHIQKNFASLHEWGLLHPLAKDWDVNQLDILKPELASEMVLSRLALMNPMILQQ